MARLETTQTSTAGLIVTHRQASSSLSLPDYQQSSSSMVRRTGKKETEEKKMIEKMTGENPESGPCKVDVNKADTRGMTPLHAAGIR